MEVNDGAADYCLIHCLFVWRVVGCRDVRMLGVAVLAWICLCVTT